MHTLDAILKRRSVRRFTPQIISPEMIERIMRAAMSAPSAVNEQPWHFVVLTERTIIDKIPLLHPHAIMCHQAPLVIIPSIDMEQEKYRDFWVQDMAAATENILIAVRALDLGAVWVGVYPNEERVANVRKLLNLPQTVTPFAIIPIGHTDVSQEELKERFRPERVHYNKW